MKNGINAINDIGSTHKSRAVLEEKRLPGGVLGYPGDIFMLVRYVTGWVCFSEKE